MSETYPAFDLLHTPLGNGTSLIEASAGTGKTHTITGLALRLILERNYGIEQVLVTTFTELATAELRDRIRRRLREALAAPEDDELVAAVVQRGACTFAQARERLDLALRSFDEAPIYTIHGFCQRMLRDRAFESGTLFNAELIQDESLMLREVAEDFWRAHFYEDSEVVTLTAGRTGIGVKTLTRLLGDIRNRPDALILPEPREGELEALREELQTKWKALCDGWEGWAEELREIFRAPAWAKHSYAKPEKMAALIAQLENCFREATGSGDELECLRKFTSGELKRFTRAGKDAPSLALFELCSEFVALTDQFGVVLKSSFCAWAREELSRRKLNRNVLSFNDLLVRLRDALRSPSGPALAASVRERFKAALLDESQDTDPVQEEIFRRIYAGAKTPENPLYLIGDPKQAIYGFRGADVFSYLAAAERAGTKFTLVRNWRSSTGLVRAVNAVFALRENAFALEKIRFYAVDASDKADRTPLLLAGQPEPPFRIWMVESDRALGVGAARDLLAERTAAEIARLLDRDATIGGKPVRPGNMAVLVADRKEAAHIQAALTEKGVPSVLAGAQSVFQSDEAAELQCILSAVAEPARDSLVRAAATTEFVGLTADELIERTANDLEWEEVLLRFAGYHELWMAQGFAVFLRHFLLEENVRARCLTRPDGERQLTNLLHLAELIQQACSARQLSVAGTFKWFAQQMSQPDPDRTEEFELRLERDDEAVRILTVHKSKGLEFDVVFCPFVGLTPSHLKSSDHFHDETNRLTIPLGETPEAFALKAEQESLAERLRLLYVALTRAKYRCTIAWGALKTKDSALAYLLDGRTPEEACADCEDVAIEPLPSADAPDYRPGDRHRVELAAREFHGRIDRTWGITSFTGLSKGHQTEPMLAELTDDEPADLPLEPAAPPTGMAAFPRGTGPGTCLHEILELIDFTDAASVAPVVQRKLAAFGYRDHDATLIEGIHRMLSVPLLPGFSLSQLAAEARLTELEFQFPINELTAPALNGYFGEGWNLSFPRVSGFLKGYIDLTFEHDGRYHVLDWKSNWLGLEPAAYTPAAMTGVIQQRHYALQLHLYVLALHRYLTLRLPNYEYDRHCGGAFYLFVRGIDPSRPELGIHREKPERARIEALDQLCQGKWK